MRFGTDGVRGVANSELTPEFAMALGRVGARVLRADRFLIARDTRRSGTMVEAALASGITSEGVDVELLGVVPTPAVAHISEVDDVAAAMISASHNPFEDNGIKLFAPGGTKLSDDEQTRMEALIAELADEPDSSRPTGAAIGTVAHSENSAVSRYEESILDMLDGRTLSGIKVVLDCANGSNSEIAGEVFRRAGASITVLHSTPDGININDRCGSTDPADLKRSVVDRGAHLGFAFDGDADRVMAVDAGGRLIDGDQMLAVVATDLRSRSLLSDDAVVVTVMTNLGFRQGMEREGVRVVETNVGDRYVLEALDAQSLSLGGEQSGHIIFRDLASTGDGLRCAVFLADVVARTGVPLGERADQLMSRLPQTLINVRLDRPDPDLLDRVAAQIETASAALGSSGRVLVRPSGTEPLVRVMVEAPTQDEATSVAETLAGAIAAAA
jgi:phosphoglucosamine mutase